MLTRLGGLCHLCSQTEERLCVWGRFPGYFNVMVCRSYACNDSLRPLSVPRLLQKSSRAKMFSSVWNWWVIIWVFWNANGPRRLESTTWIDARAVNVCGWNFSAYYMAIRKVNRFSLLYNRVNVHWDDQQERGSGWGRVIFACVCRTTICAAGFTFRTSWPLSSVISPHKTFGGSPNRMNLVFEFRSVPWGCSAWNEIHEALPVVLIGEDLLISLSRLRWSLFFWVWILVIRFLDGVGLDDEGRNVTLVVWLVGGLFEYAGNIIALSVFRECLVLYFENFIRKSRAASKIIDLMVLWYSSTNERYCGW